MIKWGGKNWRPGSPAKRQPINQSIEELMKPLGEKLHKGNVWQVVMNVPEQTSAPDITPSPTPTNTQTPSVTPTNTNTPTPSVTATQTGTPTQTPTNTPTNTLTPSSTPLPPSGTTEANAYLSAVVNAGGTGITSPISAATITLFTSLVSNGLYDKITAMYPLLGGIAASQKFNAKNPIDTNAANRLTWNGGWTYTSSGATGNASNSYARTYISGTTLNRFSIHQSYYCLANITSSDCIEMGAANTSTNTYTELAVNTTAFGGNYRTYNSNTVGNGVDSASHSAMTGYFVSSRETDTKSYLYKNGSLNYSSTTATNGTIPYEIIIGARNDNGTPNGYTNRPMGFVSIGSGLTPSEITTLTTIINNWATSVGRNTY
jgi:hypothetical protein